MGEITVWERIERGNNCVLWTGDRLKMLPCRGVK